MRRENAVLGIQLVAETLTGRMTLGFSCTMISTGRPCLNQHDALRRASNLAPFATYYVYYSAGAETV